jgi:hypothetical protein
LPTAFHALVVTAIHGFVDETIGLVGLDAEEFGDKLDVGADFFVQFTEHHGPTSFQRFLAFTA